jgi:hypothetical protein
VVIVMDASVSVLAEQAKSKDEENVLFMGYLMTNGVLCSIMEDLQRNVSTDISNYRDVLAML